MAIVFVGAVEKVVSGVASTTLAASPTPSAGNFLWLGQVEYDGGGPTIGTPTATSHTFVAATAQRAVDANNAIRMYYEANIAGGALTVTFNSASGAGDLYCLIAEFSGIATASPLDQVTASGGSGTSTTASATSGTTTQADELVIGLMSVALGGTISVTGGATQIHEDEGFTGSSSYLIVSTTGAKVASWTNPNAAWACDVATFKAVAAAGATLHPPFPTQMRTYSG